MRGRDSSFSLLSLLVMMVLMLLARAAGAEGLVADRDRIAAGETATLRLEGTTGLLRPKWLASPDGVIAFVDKDNVKALVKGLKPGQVTVSARVPGLFGSTTHSLVLTVQPPAAAQAKPGKPDPDGAGAGQRPPLDDGAMSHIGDLLRRYQAELGGIRNLFDKGADPGVTPAMDAATERRLAQVSENFFRELNAMGLSVRDLQAFKSRFMAAGPGGSPLFPGQGAWDDAFLGTERALMMGRAQLVQRLWMETLQDTFRANPDAAVFGEIDIGSWVKMRLGDLGFQADIDFSSVSIDPALNRWIADQFEGKLRAHSGLDMVQADALLTAHGQASPDVFIGHWGKSFAELDMLKRSKWKVIKVEKNTDGSLVLDGNGQPKITMTERPGSQLFWEVAFRKLEAMQARYAGRLPHELPNPHQYEVDHPTMGLDKEPMLSLEMLRHGIHDIEHGPYSRGQKLIKMLKYAERSYFMNKKALAGAGGFNPYEANHPELAQAASKIIANKNDPAMVADLLQGLAGEEITEANVDAVTDRLVALAKTAMHDNAARALAFRLNDIARIDAEDARQSALDKLWHDLETEVRTFQDSAGRPPEVMVRALELTKAVMEGKLPPSELEARSRELHALLNDAYRLPDSVIGRIMLSDSYLKVKAYLRKLGWVQKSIDDFVAKARQRYPNGAAFHDKFQEFNEQLNKTTAGSGLLKAADFADNAFSVYEAYLGSNADDALWNASLALGRAGLQEAFPSLQIPLALYDSVKTGSPKPLGMAVAFYYFPFAGQTYMVSQMMQRADVAIRDTEFYDGLNKVLEVTEFDTQGKIVGFSLKNILGKEIDSASISPPGNRKAIVALFSDPGGSFYTSPNFRYWASLVPSKDDRFGLYENKLEKLRRFFNHSEDVRYMTLMLENFRAQGAKLPQDKYTAQREAALTRMQEQLAETLWVAMADMLESAARSVYSAELEARIRKVEDDLNLGDSGLGRDKGLLARIKWEIRQNSSLFSGENAYSVGLIFDRYLKAYERVVALRRQITVDTWYTGLGLDVSAAQARPMKILLHGGKTGAPALTGDSAMDVDLAERAVAIHKQRADRIRADLAGALGRDIDPDKDKAHLKALGQLGMEWEHLLDDCPERAAGNCEAAVRAAMRERQERYKAYLAQLNAGMQPIALEISGPAEVKAGERADFSVRFDKAEDRSRPGLALRWSVDGKHAGEGEKLSLKTDKPGSQTIVLGAWVGPEREARKLGEASHALSVKDGKQDKAETSDAGLAAEIDAALRARDWKSLADKLEATRKDLDLRNKQTERWDARMLALNNALRGLKDERMKWLLAWEGYIRELERVDSRAYDGLKQEVEKQVSQYQNRCFEQGGDPAHLRGERCQKEAYAYEEKCLPKAQRDGHWAEQKAIRGARNLLPDEVHLMHSAGFPTYRAWFEKVEALAKEHGLPFPYPEPVVTRIKYVSQCAKLEDVKSSKKLDELTALKVGLKGPSAPVPLGKPVTVTASASGGKAPYSYAWSGAAGSGTRATLTPAWAGDWSVSVTVRDAEGKGGEASVTVMVSPMKIRLVGAKGQVFYGSEAKLSTAGFGLPVPAPAPTPDPCAGHVPNNNPFDPCNKVVIDPCNPMGPFCVDTTRSGTRSFGDLPPPKDGMTYDPNLVRAIPDPDREEEAKPPKPGQYRVIWQSDRNLTFNPPTSDDGTTKVTYDRMGEVKLWCELLKWESGDYQTVGECEQETITVVAPKFSVTFTPADGQAKVGQEVRARINTQPGVPAKLIDYRWLEPATSNRMEYTENAGEIGFRVKDPSTLVLKALARVPYWGDEIGSIDATYTGAVYGVKAWAVEPGTRPRMWDPKKGGLVPVPKGSYATFERIGLKAEVQGGPTEGVRWQWTVNDGTSISNPWSQTPTVSRSEAGGISARVVARDANGVELGSAELGLSVIEVSEQPPKSAPAEEKKQRQEQARQLGKQAEEQLKRGDLPGAAQSARQARSLDPAVAAPAARKVAEAAKQAGWQGVYNRDFSQVVPNLETAVELNPDDKDAQGKLERARRFVQVWPQVEARAREFDAQMAEKKYFTAHQTLLAMQDLQKEMPGTTEKSLHNRTMRDFDAGMAEYNTYMGQVEDTHRRTFQEKDWQTMLDNSEQALRREHSLANEKMLKSNVAFARQMLREQAEQESKALQSMRPVPRSQVTGNRAETISIDRVELKGVQAVRVQITQASGLSAQGRRDSARIGEVEFWNGNTRVQPMRVAAESTYPGYQPGQAMDGQRGYRYRSDGARGWASAEKGPGESTWIQFDFATAVDIDRVVVTTAPTEPYRLHSLELLVAGRGAGDAPPLSSGQGVAGTWAIDGNGYKGKLEISEQGGKLSGRVWYDLHGRWETLQDVSFDGRNLAFTRPIPGATQRYTGTVAGNEFRGTFTQQGTSAIYNWSVKRTTGPASASEINLPSGMALATDKASYAPGETITLRFGGIAQPMAQDWISLYAEGMPNEKYGEWHYLKAQAGGTLQFKAPQQPGSYEFRLFLNWPAGGYKDVARSPRITVGAGQGGSAPGPATSGSSLSADGLVAAYALDGDARDASGQGRHGDVHGATPTADRFGRAGGAMAFDGKGWIELPLDINPGVLPRLTFTAWVRADETNARRQLMSHDNGNFDRTLGIDYRGGGEGWSAFSGSGSVLGFQPVDKGRWTFVAGVWDQDAGKVRLHVDGRVFEEAGKSGPGHNRVALGRNPSFGEYFVGALDDVRFHDRALSPAEIAAIRGESGMSPGSTTADTDGPSASVGGRWKTSEGELTLRQSGNRVTGSYGTDRGEIEAELRGGVLEGWWIEDHSGQNCGVARNGRKYWGRIRWTFDGDRFVGGWSYCDGNVGPDAASWKGERIGAAPAPSPASRAEPKAPVQAEAAPAQAAESLEDSVRDLGNALKELKGLFNW